jgi:hypothetical protein
MVLLIALTIPIYRTGDATTLDGFPFPANDNGTIWRNSGVRVRFLGENPYVLGHPATFALYVTFRVVPGPP